MPYTPTNGSTSTPSSGYSGTTSGGSGSSGYVDSFALQEFVKRASSGANGVPWTPYSVHSASKSGSSS
ncbi:hypothetical protein FQN49_007897 [Arthroderma sp. PD_2]|nr:hypothetical protein FQN49_007897 [Arthroderma sp. PD_2]